jgi:hypothetical protein
VFTVFCQQSFLAYPAAWRTEGELRTEESSIVRVRSSLLQETGSKLGRTKTNAIKNQMLHQRAIALLKRSYCSLDAERSFELMPDFTGFCRRKVFFLPNG